MPGEPGRAGAALVAQEHSGLGTVSKVGLVLSPAD